MNAYVNDERHYSWKRYFYDDIILCHVNLTSPLGLGLVALLIGIILLVKVQEYYHSLTSPPPVKVSRYPEDKHGGHGDRVCGHWQFNSAIQNQRFARPWPEMLRIFL